MEDNKIFKDYKFRLLIISGSILGLLSHGMALFNKYSFHDDPYALNTLGSTFNFGRWTLGIMDIFTLIAGGSKHYSFPVIEGSITILCLIMSIYLISRRMQIESKLINVLMCGIFIAFPAITGILGYMYTAPHYYIGMFLGVLGAYIYSTRKTVLSAIACTSLMACSVGAYQANIPACVTTLILFMIEEVYREDISWVDYIKKGINNVVICLGFLVEYLILNKFFIWLFKTRLPGYRNLNNFGMTSVRGYIGRIILCYKEFFSPNQWSPSSVYQFNAKFFYQLLLIATLVVFILFAKKLKLNKAIQLLVLFAVLPLSSHMIYVMVDVEMIYVIMVYGIAYLYVAIGWLLDRVQIDTKPRVIARKVTLILFTIVLYFDIRYSNICYLKAELLQSQAISYFTTLITSIKSIDGYRDDMIVVYINELEKSDESMAGTSQLFDYITASPYNSGNTVLNEYSWKEMMAQWCGYSPTLGNEEDYLGNAEVEAMPCYPNDGSIKIIDGQIVVKFAEYE